MNHYNIFEDETNRYIGNVQAESEQEAIKHFQSRNVHAVLMPLGAPAVPHTPAKGTNPFKEGFSLKDSIVNWFWNNPANSIRTVILIAVGIFVAISFLGIMLNVLGGLRF